MDSVHLTAVEAGRRELLGPPGAHGKSRKIAIFFFMMNVFVELGEGAAQLAASPAASVGPCCAKAWS